MGTLDGRCALVTGAGSGVGRAVALRYARAGALVIMVDVSAEGMARTIELAGPELEKALVPAVADVREIGQVRAAVRAAQDQAGGVDVVAAIAGFSKAGRMGEMDHATRDAILGVNLTGVWNTMEAALPSLLARGPGGRIIVCGSVECVLAGESLAAYVASKHGVLGLAKSMALELATSGITVNVVSPAGVDTEMLRAVVPPEDIAHVAATTPVPRLSTPEEVAAFFEFLAGPETGYLTGENIIVDGGLKLVNAHTAGVRLGQSKEDR